MEKKKYESTELEIIKYQSEDVLTNSRVKGEDDELPFIPNHSSNPNP
jgi:hypothetical protein